MDELKWKNIQIPHDLLDAPVIRLNKAQNSFMSEEIVAEISMGIRRRILVEFVRRKDLDMHEQLRRFFELHHERRNLAECKNVICDEWRVPTSVMIAFHQIYNKKS